MSWWKVWDTIKRPPTDRSRSVKTGQNECKDDASASKGDAGGAKAHGRQKQNNIEGTSQRENADRLSDVRSEARRRYERDLEALSQNCYPPDIQAFADYLRAGERGGSIELLFEHLWEAYVIHCDESNRRAVTPRQLQNAWHKVGHTRRESSTVAPRRRWYLLPDDTGKKSAEADLVAFSPRRSVRR